MMTPTPVMPTELRPRHVLCDDRGKPFGIVTSHPTEDPETGALWVPWACPHDGTPMGDVVFELTDIAIVLA